MPDVIGLLLSSPRLTKRKVDLIGIITRIYWRKRLQHIFLDDTTGDVECMLSGTNPPEEHVVQLGAAVHIVGDIIKSSSRFHIVVQFIGASDCTRCLLLLMPV